VVVEDAAIALVVVGGLLVVGLVAEFTGARLPVPKVTVLILVGVLVGPAVLGLLPDDIDDWFPLVTALALSMAGLLVGGEFTRDRVVRFGRVVGAASLTQALVCVAVVGGGLLVLGVDGRVALALAGIAVANAPATIESVIEESRPSLPVAEIIRGVAALADALSLVAVSILVVVAGTWHGVGEVGGAAATAAWELFGAVALGVVLGVPGALLSGRLHAGRPVLEEALGLVLLSTGLALWLDVSFLLSAIVMGVVITNLASHHERTFREVEGIEWPVLVVFFVLSGAQLEFDALAGAGPAVIAYVLLRSVAKVGGTFVGLRLGGATPAEARWLGVGLLPQAGVALGLALLVEDQLPEVGPEVVAITVASSVFFEIVGPVLTRFSLQRATAP
jgi:Kef-type K+ transport system membrane component KefB